MMRQVVLALTAFSTNPSKGPRNSKLAYEAGRDGFWLARWLIARGIEAHVIHSASVAVSRERKRAKTDRLDAAMLMRVFLGWLRGERGHCGMVAIPTMEEEDARRPKGTGGSVEPYHRSTAFRSGRDFAAWSGLVPRQGSTGGKQKLGPVSKQGDRYLRRILVVGAHAVLRYEKQNPEKYPWVTQLLARQPFKVVAIGLRFVDRKRGHRHRGVESRSLAIFFKFFPDQWGRGSG